jgi:hypothetical protein
MRIWFWLLLSVWVWAEPGLVLVYNGRVPNQVKLVGECKRYLQLLRDSNQLAEYQLYVGSVDLSQPAQAGPWQKDFALTLQDTPALGVVNRQGNRLSLENLIRRPASAIVAAEEGYRCLQVAYPNLISQAQVLTQVALASEPAGASLEVDGQMVGVSPAKLPIKPGRHRLTVSLPGYQSFSQDVQVSLGQTLQLAPKLVARTGYLRIESAHEPFEVSLDEGPFEGTPCVHELKIGNHRYQTRAAGCYASSGEIEVVEDRLTSMRVSLVPVKLRINIPPVQAFGYSGYNRRTRTSGNQTYEYLDPYQVSLEPVQLWQHLHDGLSRAPGVELVTSEPDCLLQVEIRSSKDEVSGVVNVLDFQGRMLDSQRRSRSMPFLTFDESGSAQLRAGEVVEDLLQSLLPNLSRYMPANPRTPSDRRARVDVERSKSP